MAQTLPKSIFSLHVFPTRPAPIDPVSIEILQQLKAHSFQTCSTASLQTMIALATGKRVEKLIRPEAYIRE